MKPLSTWNVSLFRSRCSNVVDRKQHGLLFHQVFIIRSRFYFEERLLSEKYVLKKRNSKNKSPDEFVNNEDFMYFDQVKIDLERLFILITQSFSRSLLSTSKLLNISTGRD